MKPSRSPIHIVAFYIFLIVGHCIAATPKPPCKGNAQVIDDCFSLHGRVRFYNGNPSFRIWTIGTKHLLGIHENWDPQNPNRMVPENLSNLMNPYDDVFGNFIVCPFTRYKPGWMQSVCVESASSLVIVTRDKEGKRIAEKIKEGNDK